MRIRNLSWTLDFKHRLWSNHPTEALVRPDYVVLQWESLVGFTSGVLPTMLVASSYCYEDGGKRIFNLSISAKNTSRRGPSGKKRTVRRPRKLLSSTRAFKYQPFDDIGSSGEFYIFPSVSSSIPTAKRGSGLFWDYFRWWIMPVDNSIVNGYAQFLPNLYGISFPYNLIGDPSDCNLDDHLQCLSACSLSTDNILYQFGPGNRQIAINPSSFLTLSDVPALPGSSDSIVFTSTVFNSILTRYSSLYPNASLSLTQIYGDSSHAWTFLRVLTDGAFTYYDANGDETSVPSEMCTYHFDYVPIYRLDAFKCAIAVIEDCSGRDAGWYLNVCITWVDPLTSLLSSICQTYLLFPPLGMPFEGNNWQVNLANSLLSVMVDKVNILLSDLLQSVVLTAPPMFRVVGKFVLFFYDLYDIKVGATIFYCPGSLPDTGNTFPTCSPRSFLLSAEPL